MTELYISGSSKTDPEMLEQEISRIQNRLLSTHADYLNFSKAWVSGARDLGLLPKSIILDSGAFTAWSKGSPVTVDAVLRAYSQIMEIASKVNYTNIWMINLDEIPGKKGVDPTADEILQAVENSDRNLSRLQQEFGDRILPVFHQGETGDRLKEIQKQSKFICISPRNDLGEKIRVSWAYEVHSLIGDHNSTHGLAATGAKMLRVPWFSVDSASAVHIAAFGSLLIHTGDKLQTITISEKSQSYKTQDKHFDSLNSYEKNRVQDLIQQDSFSIEELKEDYYSRMLFNMRQMQQFVTFISQFQSHTKQDTLFGI